MAEALPAELPNDVRSVVLHCRPRLTFHLGHLRMLNVLYSLLQRGVKVTILVVPYVEHEPANRTYLERLRQDYAITRGFYRTYLGFPDPPLSILSYEELPVESADIERFRALYRQLYEDQDRDICGLVNEHQRPWSSPGIDFVPKCLAALEYLAADAMVAGKKHDFISDCFARLLAEAGNPTKAYVFEDLLDLRMTTGMDRTDSVNTFIEINDQEDFVLYKLDALRAEPQLLSEWLNHFASLVLSTSPERARAGVSNTHRTDPERIIALSKALQNVRQMVPYGYQPPPSQFKVLWSDELFRKLGAADKATVERLTPPIYATADTKSITIYKSFTEGQSGGAAYAVSESSDIDGRHETRTSVLKVGDALALNAERDAYLELIEPVRTGAFLSIRSSHSMVDGEAAIVYEDANRQVGGSLSGMEPLHRLFRPTAKVDLASQTLHDLLANHLYETLYRHGQTQDRGSVRYVMNEFLPAAWRVRVDHVDGDAVAVGGRSVGVDRIFSGEVLVTEFNPNKALARAYSEAHDKLDLVLDDLREQDLARFTVGASIEIEGTVIEDRLSFFQTAERLAEQALVGSARTTFTSPVETLERLQSTLQQDMHNFCVSAVHGDLHGGNVLVTPTGHVGIIDYGKTRPAYPSLYDVAFLMADLKIRMIAEQMTFADLAKAEHALTTGRDWWAQRRLGDEYRRLELFEYDRLPASIQQLGSRSLYYAFVAVACLGRLKFDIQSVERFVALELAHSTLNRLDG